MKHYLPILIALLVTACAEKQYNEIALMPSPVAYTTGAVDPFRGRSNTEVVNSKLFYATDRAPADDSDASEFYANRRGYLLRVGSATVTMTPPATNWSEVREITQSADREVERTLSVTAVEEIGPLPIDSPNPLVEQPSANVLAETKRSFRAQVNRQLAGSGGRDAVIYVHGYNVDFEYPTLVSRELQHFLGYEGVFISYNWPATPNRAAYFKDLETVSATRRNLRSLIEFLVNDTNVRRVHLIGYSAGSRLAFETAYQLTLQSNAGHGNTWLGQVILVGSDLDRTYFAEALGDGLLDNMDQLSIYMSGSDAALNMSRLVFGQHRLGQIWESNEDTQAMETKLSALSKLALIDVTRSPGSALGNGHWYFRSSPWASNDILLTLLKGLAPQDRGLVREPGTAVWHFPEDYPDRIQRIARNSR